MDAEEIEKYVSLPPDFPHSLMLREKWNCANHTSRKIPEAEDYFGQGDLRTITDCSIHKMCYFHPESHNFIEEQYCPIYCPDYSPILQVKEAKGGN